MGEFLSPVDIANRALQHCGAAMLDAALGFTEISVAARQTGFAYPKLRRAELERNDWRFAIRRACLRAIDTTTRLVVPSVWAVGTTYFIGAIVSDESDNLWINRIPDNLGNEPQLSTTWEPYFGPLTVSLYDSGTTYFSGELVYTAIGDGTYRVFLSLQNANADNPATPTPWDAATTFMRDQVVQQAAISYLSLIDLNTGNDPSLGPPSWSALVTYAIAAQVVGTDGVIYTSVVNGNLNIDPVADAGTNWTNTGVLGKWATAFVGGTGSDKWLQIGGAEFPMGVGLTGLDIVYPVAAGPVSQAATRNVYRLPAGYLREAAQNPKGGSGSWLGAPSGITYNDWLFEGDYIVTGQGDPILFRFVADVNDVRRMTDMFCEGLAARIAQEVCEPLTQSTAKLGAITAAYKKVMDDARTVNAIEIGTEDAPDDDYLTVRY